MTLRPAEPRFIGSQTAKVDAKGRIAAPADFRRTLEAKGANGFFATPNLHHPEYLDCGGPDFYAGLRDFVDAYPALGEDRVFLQEALIGRMKEIPFDADGRFILPAAMKEKVGAKDSVFFIGFGDTFQIREGAIAEARMKDVEQRAREAALRLNIPANQIFRKAAP